MAFRGPLIATLIASLSLLPLLSSCASKPPPGDETIQEKNHADSDHSRDNGMGGGGYSSS